MSLHRTAPQGGFTLIEVLAALAVLALALSAALVASTFYARSTGDLEERMLASVVAHNLMVETLLEDNWPSKGRKSRDVELAGRDWETEREVEDTPDSYIRRVTVRVRRDGQKDGWILQRAAFLAEPTAALPQSAPPQGDGIRAGP
ncbi:MAG: type II secretion system minor pseudopilin GspI [Oceanococcaceae bacterium]